MPIVELKDIGDLQEINAGSDALGSRREIELIVGIDDTLSQRTHFGKTRDRRNGDPSRPTRAQITIDIAADVAAKCYQLDSQGEHEEGGGGARVIRWGEGWTDEGDWNPDNLEEKAKQFKFDQRDTKAMQMVAGVTSVYTGEFCVDKNGNPTPVDGRPALLIGKIGDGWCSDNADFERWAERLGGDTFLVDALVGDGDDYDRALEEYGKVAKKNPHYTLIPFATATDVSLVSQAFMRLAGKYQG
jgi:hypothetical protein